LDRSTPLWKVWWIYGAPVAIATGVLLYFAEELRLSYYPAWADLLDTARLATFWLWCWLAWTCARNVERRVWTPVARAALAAGLVVTVAI
jgi:hypothetical protein